MGVGSTRTEFAINLKENIMQQGHSEDAGDWVSAQADADTKAKAAAEEAENKRISEVALAALVEFPELRKRTLDIWWRVAPAYQRAKQHALAVAGGKMRGPYDNALREYLHQYGLDRLHKGTRSALVFMQENKEDLVAWLDTMATEDNKTRVVHPTLVVAQYKDDRKHLAAWKAEFPNEAGKSNSPWKIWEKFHLAKAKFDPWLEATEFLEWPKPSAEKDLTVPDRLWEQYRNYKLQLDGELKSMQAKPQRQAFDADPIQGWVERLKGERVKENEDANEAKARGETEAEDETEEDETKVEAKSEAEDSTTDETNVGDSVTIKQAEDSPTIGQGTKAQEIKAEAGTATPQDGFHDKDSVQSERQIGPDEALPVLIEFAEFVIARISRREQEIIVTVTKQDVNLFEILLSRAGLAIGE